MLNKIHKKKRGFCTIERIITFAMILILINLSVNIIIVAIKNTEDITQKLNNKSNVLNVIKYIQMECDDSEKISYYAEGIIGNKKASNILVLEKVNQYRCFYIVDNQLYSTLLYKNFHDGNNESDPPNPMAYNNNSIGGFSIFKKSGKIFMCIKIDYEKYNYFLCIENSRGFIK